MTRPTCRRCNKPFTKRDTASESDPAFHSLCAPRVRFNWGFHDARAEAARGAARDVSAHFDANYRIGYFAGLASAQAGEDTETSEPAWVARTA